jgi:Protein of unknown function (DUF1064)
MPVKYKVAAEIERTVDGIVFDSKREAARYAQLKLAEKAGLIRNLVLQPEYPVEINGKHYCTYTPDFRYTEAETGKEIIEEVKSTGTMKDPAYRLRKKAAELFHGVEITVFIVGWQPKKKKKWTRPPRKLMLEK